ncbi:S-layer homology domain-containing protein [Paenibacillus sanguinis]|uniref:S-layer homology domain-containing protein n=1 Tax=Paenibacillus sanguinis TaxID=225906 RepID=UPI00039D1FEE|nr:S-layer homology domain-containing protein [Paenibacillus sanguinis]
MKKILSMLMIVALLITVVPTAWPGTADAASGTYFIFPNERYAINDARVVNTDRVDLTGSFNNVNKDTISYSVYQLSKNGDEVSSNVGQTGNIYPSGSELKILNVKLFSGLNKIVIQGKKGSSSVSDTIYIEYRNGPTLSDLSARLNGDTVPLSEGKPAVLFASAVQEGDSDTQIVISGFAKNANKVTIDTNGKSWTFNVSSSNDYRFTAGTVRVNKGNNILTITASNNDQSVTTTRQVTFYNGELTFYDTYLKDTDDNTISADLTTSPDFSVVDTNNIEMHGTVLVPFAETAPDNVTLQISSSPALTPTSIVVPSSDFSEKTNSYVKVPFVIPFNSGAAFDTKINLNLKVDGLSGSEDFFFRLRDKGKSYIHEVNYLQGYNSSTGSNEAYNLTGSSMEDRTTDIHSVPAGIEVIVVSKETATDANKLTIRTSDSAIQLKEIVPSNASYQYTTRMINGVQTSVKRIVVSLDSLPSATSTIPLELVDGSGTVFDSRALNVKMLYGPYATFNSVYDGQQIKIDTNEPGETREQKLDAVDHFKGQLFNISNKSDIKYTGADRTVSLYINNELVALEADGEVSSFRVTAGGENAAADALVVGANTIRFVYQSGSDSYVREIKVNITTSSIALIPVEGSIGIVPFTYDGESPRDSYNDVKITKADPNFVGGNGSYTTTKPKMNIFGTFDFIDLGSRMNNVQDVLDKVSGKSGYKLKIEASDGKTTEWSLDDTFYGDDNARTVFNSGSTIDDLAVYYHPKEEDFSFVLFNQSVPQDGTALIYNFTLYNGEGSSGATYRMEVRYSTSSLNIVRPVTNNMKLNQNFVEVIVDSPNADSVTIDGETAERIDFDADYDGDIDYHSVFSYIVKGLKPNKETKISIEVAIGDQKLKEEIRVTYVPANIPGAQVMETMKKSHKVFEGSLQLTFPTNTSLLRHDYYAPERYKDQVYTKHDFLFGIANGEDGAVDRFNDLDDRNNLFKTGEQYFVGEFPDRFGKVSPVFWIDAGIADDLKTDVYDPVTKGVGPYQLSSTSRVKSFYNRSPEDELIPSKRGELTLTYDSSVTDDAGKLITVLHFNPESGTWENIGGVVNAKKNTIEVPFDQFGYYVVAKLGETYTDIISHPYARDYLETLYAKGIMNPEDPSVGFKPDINIKRAEFTQMIVKAQQLPLNYLGRLSFDDVSRSYTNNLWDFRYVETAARAGIIKGIQPRVFDPDSNITRQDAAVVMAKALNLKLQTKRETVNKGLAKYFKDYADIDYYAAPSVLAIAQKGFISGSPIDPSDPKKGYNFNPTSFTLRGDAAVIVGRVMASTKKLPAM